LIIRVPPGTVVKDPETGDVLADLVENGQTFIAARGGRGGRGNARFASSIHRAPDFAEKGEPGEERWILLELKLIADVGLIGFPNAGKSTLLSRMTSARPKIADYPFTTLSPNLGVVDLGTGEGRSFVVADIPGLIEGAHEGLGLGHEFLRHVERTRLLVHVIDAAGLENDPIEGFHVINRELREYSLKLSQKPQLIAANKMDLPQARENYERIEAAFKKEGFEVMPISGATGQGVKQLLLRIQQILSKMPETVETEEIKEYTIREEEPFKISKGGQVFSVSGSLVERLVAMTDLENESAVKRLQRTFKKIGLDEALKKEGIKQGDSVKIGDVEFYYME
jgi:GTP-binding protein